METSPLNFRSTFIDQPDSPGRASDSISVGSLTNATGSVAVRVVSENSQQREILDSINHGVASRASSLEPLAQASVQTLSQSAFEEIRTEIESECPDASLARALFQNQFQLVSEAEENIKQRKDPATFIGRSLRAQLELGDERALLNDCLQRIPVPMPEYDLFSAEKRAVYRELGQIIFEFRTTELAAMEPAVYTDTEGREKEENTTQVFNTRLQNFLAQHPHVTKRSLLDFLAKYNMAPQEAVDESLAQEVVPLMLRDVSEGNAHLIQSAQKVFKAVNAVAHNEEAFCSVLTELLNVRAPIYKDNGRIKLTRLEREYFINVLLKNFGIFQEKNEEVFALICTYYEIFGSVPIDTQKTKPHFRPYILEFQNKAKRLLQRDDQNRQHVTLSSKTIKERVKEYQLYQKTIEDQNKAIIETNKLLPEENHQELVPLRPMEHASTKRFASSEPLLEPQVRTLLMKIATILPEP